MSRTYIYIFIYLFYTIVVPQFKPTSNGITEASLFFEKRGAEAMQGIWR